MLELFSANVCRLFAIAFGLNFDGLRFFFEFNFRNCRKQSNLRIWTNGYDFVIAEDERWARFFVAQTIDENDPDIIDGEGWSSYANDENFRFWDGDQHINRPAWMWCEQHGEGYFACSEY